MDELRTVQIRNLRVEIWVEIRAEAVRRGVDTAELVERVWREWRACRKQPVAS